jgi:hypothetical protein
VKHLSTLGKDINREIVSSGERKRLRLNLFFQGLNPKKVKVL